MWLAAARPPLHRWRSMAETWTDLLKNTPTFQRQSRQRVKPRQSSFWMFSLIVLLCHAIKAHRFLTWSLLPQANRLPHVCICGECTFPHWASHACSLPFLGTYSKMVGSCPPCTGASHLPKVGEVTLIVIAAASYYGLNAQGTMAITYQPSSLCCLAFSVCVPAGLLLLLSPDHICLSFSCTWNRLFFYLRCSYLTGHVPVWQRVFNIYKGCFYMCTWTHCPRTPKLHLVGVAWPLKSEWWGSSRSLSFTSSLVMGSFLLLYNSVSSSVNCCWRLWLLFLLQGRHSGNEFESTYTWICYLPSELYTRWVLNNKQRGGKEHIVGKWAENPWFRCWVLPWMLSSHRALKVPGWVGNTSNFSTLDILSTWALDCLGYTYLCNHDKVSIYTR